MPARGGLLALSLSFASFAAGCHEAPAEPNGRASPPPATPSPSAQQIQTVQQSLSREQVAAFAHKFNPAANAVLPLPPTPAPADVDRPPATALRGPSGIRYEVLASRRGGVRHEPWDDVDLRYTIWSSGGVVTASRAFGAEDSVTYSAESLPREWAAQVNLLNEGDKGRFWYTQPAQGGPQRFLADFEVLHVRSLPEPPPVPSNLAAPPHDAHATSGGVAFVLLAPGSEDAARPRRSDQVELALTGWQGDGFRFFTTVGKAPIVLALAELPSGVGEALQHLPLGARARFWVPAELGRALRLHRFPRWPFEGYAVLDLELRKIVDAERTTRLAPPVP